MQVCSYSTEQFPHSGLSDHILIRRARYDSGVFAAIVSQESLIVGADVFAPIVTVELLDLCRAMDSHVRYVLLVCDDMIALALDRVHADV